MPEPTPDRIEEGYAIEDQPGTLNAPRPSQPNDSHSLSRLQHLGKNCGVSPPCSSWYQRMDSAGQERHLPHVFPRLSWPLE
jgi:hypothetical protein